MNEDQLYQSILRLSQDVAVLVNRIDTLAEVVETSNKNLSGQNGKIDSLEKSRTQLRTVIVVLGLTFSSITSLSFWIFNAYVHDLIDRHISEIDIIEELCDAAKEQNIDTKYRIEHCA